MKRLFLLCLLCPAAYAANPALGIHNISSTDIAAYTYTSPSGYTSQSTGSSFVVFLTGTSSGSTSNVTVTDNFSNTYSIPTLGSGTNPIDETQVGYYIYAFVCTGCTGGTNHEITASVSGSDWKLQNVDFIEIENTSAIDVSASAVNTSGAVCNVSVTPTVSNDFLLGACVINGSRTLTSSTFTMLDTSSVSPTLGSAYLSGAGTSTYNAAITSGTNYDIAGITLGFKPAGSSGPPKSQFLLGSRYTVPLNLANLAHR